MRFTLMSLVGLLWLGACRPRANSEPPAPESEPEPESESEPAPAVEPWLQIEEDDGSAAGQGLTTPPSLDPCMTGPEDFDGFQDEDGCSDPDNDGDGIADIDDMCPNNPEDFDGFQDEDGCPDPDKS